ncbi:MAG TPA: 6-pyruvoyl-tetrahydropterin synthase-related protein [Blastocatellia bacterium]|nr:6-pyruvoyl-tetrahydropterin synthase-related protein [Blastocatellia bacterium]
MENGLLQTDSVSKAEAKDSALKRLLTKAIMPVAILLLGVLLVAPFFFKHSRTTPEGKRELRPITTHDMSNHVHNMQQFDKSLRAGVLQPRWFSEVNNGYGSATLNYTYRSLYYLTSLGHFLTGDWWWGVFLVCAFALVGSGLSFYYLARQWYGKTASIIGTLLYMLLPYHLLNLYWRGALSEFLGYVLLPLIMLFALRLGSMGRLRHYALFGLFYGIYLLTHMPTGILLTYTLAFFAVVWTAKERDLKVGLRLAAGMTVGLMLSATYWLPAALETKDVYEYATDLFPYHRQYITLIGEGDYFTMIVNYMFVLQAIALILCARILFVVKRTEDEKGISSNDNTIARRRWAVSSMSILLAVTTLFMSTSFSVYISKMLPKIQLATPPWRWFTIANFFLSLLACAAIERLRGYRAPATKRIWAYRAALGAVVALNIYFALSYVLVAALSNGPQQVSYPYVEDSFTPKGSTRPQDLPDTPPVTFKPEGGAVEIKRWEPQYREMAVRVTSPSVMRLKTYAFPGWKAEINGQEAKLLSDRDGVQILALDPGIHQIKVAFVNTPPRTAGTALSTFALLFILGLIGFDYYRRRKRRGKSAETSHHTDTEDLEAAQSE